MKTLQTLIALAILFTQPAHAEEDEKYLLGDIGVRIDLPASVQMTRWSDWDFKAETKSPGVMMFAWTEGVQSPMTATSADDWSGPFIAKAKSIGGDNATVDKATFSEGQTVLNISVSFTFESRPMFLHGSAHSVAGTTFYMATVSNKRNSRRAKLLRNTLRDTLDLRSPPSPTVANALLSAAGVETVLPDGWREPLNSEMTIVNKRVASIGVTLEDHCFAALHPNAGDTTPDIAVTCQGGLWLGIIDELSFLDKEAELRTKIFGHAPVTAATPTHLTDRMAFVYQHTLGNTALAVGVVPYQEGVSRTWIIGDSAHLTDNHDALANMLANSTYSGPHPVSLGDRLDHLMYRPMTLAGLVGVFLLLLGGVLLGAKRVLGGKNSEFEEF